MLDLGAVLAVALLAGTTIYLALAGRLGRLAAILVALTGSLLVTGTATWSLAGSRSFQLFDTMVARVETDRPVIALTFDDGPTGIYTDQALALLAKENVRATFFLTGQEVAGNPGAARAIAVAGHELGNHSWSHQRMVFRSMSFIRTELQQTDAALRSIGYRGPIHFRSPYGKRLVALPLYLHQTGRLNIFFDIEPESDPDVDGDAGRIAAHVTERARPGSIVLLHVMYGSRQASRDALPMIISELKRRGFEFVTVSELLALREDA